MIKGQWVPAEQRGVLAKAEATRPFASGTERETHRQLPPEQQRVVGQGEAPEKLSKCHKPVSLLRHRCSVATRGKNFSSPAHLLNAFTVFLWGWDQKLGAEGVKVFSHWQQVAVSLLWHVRAVCDFICMISKRMYGYCIQWHICEWALRFWWLWSCKVLGFKEGCVCLKRSSITVSPTKTVF